MNSAARRIGRTLALVLPVVLVLSGTLAVTRVPWASPTSESQMLTASSGTAASHQQPRHRAPQEVLRDQLLAELQEKNPGTALTHLQEATTKRPSLAKHCASIARALGRAAVEKYGASHRAQAYSRPVCDTSFASGVATAK
ncbi:hypothetical protein [Streptomyces purpurogeneiscleroticus]|uniref:hypothetical protein n=1 Tax=Streptomyces purpurogeneiscleroticus TaxID=68259 RepID=UPI001CC16759|nr:hypothetical protein [Streptomyces purpurogeneiscleroticus]MBZ4014210.1 hypothetical protein [Streptomyces purpurogeneiscleroticus]